LYPEASEKVTPDTQKGDPEYTEKVTLSTQKGDPGSTLSVSKFNRNEMKVKLTSSDTTNRGNISASPSGGVNDSAQDKTTAPSESATPSDRGVSSDLLEEVKSDSKYSTIDVESEYKKWIEKCQQDSKPMTRKWLKGWLDLAVKHVATQRASSTGYGRADAERDKELFEKMSDEEWTRQEPVYAELAKTHAETIVRMPGIEGKHQDADICVWLKRHIPGDYNADGLRHYVSEFLNKPLIWLYFVDKVRYESLYLKDTDYGRAGVFNIVKSDGGMERLKGSKWLTKKAA
jgi:hypothetical protein